jgi:hypothetical protein
MSLEASAAFRGALDVVSTGPDPDDPAPRRQRDLPQVRAVRIEEIVGLLGTGRHRPAHPEGAVG